ncbi:hypothetical protein QBC34DRAFT_98068 [Podospora aff. communis PSN243]|uniref:Uncharacterized protein n=1 Tax=Podospora aff. communis PSN243 TaxID=3040156 RepID=A0AAV9GM92_9PEZI|nr:hypothetical protein QBC34DRAFT_98068 [Podospora aff. communis PSN243]
MSDQPVILPRPKPQRRYSNTRPRGQQPKRFEKVSNSRLRPANSSNCRRLFRRYRTKFYTDIIPSPAQRLPAGPKDPRVGSRDLDRALCRDPNATTASKWARHKHFRLRENHRGVSLPRLKRFLPFICQTVGTTTKVTKRPPLLFLFCRPSNGNCQRIPQIPKSNPCHPVPLRQAGTQWAIEVEVSRWRSVTPIGLAIRCCPSHLPSQMGGFVSAGANSEMFALCFGFRLASASQLTNPDFSKAWDGKWAFMIPSPFGLFGPGLVDYYHHRFFSSNFRALCSLHAGSLKRSGLKFRELGPWTFRQPHRDAGEPPLFPRLPAQQGTRWEGQDPSILAPSRRGSPLAVAFQRWVSHESVCGSALMHDWGAQEGHHFCPEHSGRRTSGRKTLLITGGLDSKRDGR